jgi:hypothetical protein
VNAFRELNLIVREVNAMQKGLNPAVQHHLSPYKFKDDSQFCRKVRDLLSFKQELTAHADERPEVREGIWDLEALAKDLNHWTQTLKRDIAISVLPKQASLHEFTPRDVR